MSILDLFMDPEWRAIRAVSRQMDANLDAAMSNDLAFHGRLRKVEDELALTVKELDRTRAILKCLVDAVIDAGGVQGKVLEARIEAALDALEPPPPPAPETAGGGDPYRGAPGRAAEAEPTTVCARCGGTFPLSRTNVTEAGNVCDGCSAK